jgi:hypothetical protein
MEVQIKGRFVDHALNVEDVTLLLRGSWDGNVEILDAEDKDAGVVFTNIDEMIAALQALKNVKQANDAKLSFNFPTIPLQPVWPPSGTWCGDGVG